MNMPFQTKRIPIALCFFLLLGTPSIFADSYADKMPPSDHKAKKWLDKLFKNQKYPETKKDFMRMGFRNFTRPDSQGPLVFKHRGCRGYLFKLYTNRDGSIDEARVLANRIKGAEVIRRYIEEKGYHHYFKVPKKWLYHHQSPSHYILVVEDMHILSRDKNLKRWKNKKITESLLKALVMTLTDLGLVDSIYIDNIPFSKDGKIAFIDTEHYHSNLPVRLDLLSHCLPEHMLPYWRSLFP